MKQTCLFKHSYNKRTKSYSASFRGLSKQQFNALMSIFHTLSSVGVVLTYEDGFTVPMYELRCSVPLSRGAGSSMVVPNVSLNSLLSSFRNTNIPLRDVIVSPTGDLLTRNL